ncbi:MAG TPA: peptide MFS transporter [Thermoanaerobaculia bacterium]|jgi:POT family proton-dependent oligopeptide transporter|nr:peptide MFS transporter [Thermoanaerobaculia bacterium]
MTPDRPTATAAAIADRPRERTFLGHPIGLATLFGTEMFERFSYYGMRALLILFMTATAQQGGLGFSTEKASSIYGWYTSGVYLLAIFGGLAADYFLGLYRSVLIGGIIIALGHFTMAIPTQPAFFTGLVLIVLGTGLLKPNVSSLVGTLYEKGDHRRDAGFSIFYMGINLGAFIAPLICGPIGQRINWHWGFACAGIGMTLGLIQYVLGSKYVVGREAPRNRAARESGIAAPPPDLTPEDWKRMGVIGILFVFSCLFWMAFEQAGSSLNLFAERYTRLHMFGLDVPASTLQAIQPMFVILLSPIFAVLWMSLGNHEPSSPTKFSYGLFLVGLGMLLLVPAARTAQTMGVKVSPWWLVGVYFLHTMGELCLSPVGLSVVTKLAPQRFAGSMMGIWFLSLAVGNKAAGYAAGMMDKLPLTKLFGTVAVITIAAGVVLVLLIKPIRSLMGDVH